MTLPTKYNPADVEDKWYKYWMDYEFFKSRSIPGKKPYTILMPPPNVTGVLHMGHVLNNAIQDVLIRKARMDGKAVCWVPGIDHASIATEARVVAMLREKNIKKSDLTREQFLTYAWEWKEKYGGIILEQLKKLGASCDWERTRFTMDEGYYKSVISVFVDLYRKGYIYRGLRMINWDCEAKTALSSEEVLYREEGEKSTLYSIRYAIEGEENANIIIATQRPETIFGDTAIAVNPNDARYQHLVGKKALVPFIRRPIPIIADAYVDQEFGTGCLKVTPAHDVNDYEIGLRHHLPVIDTINDDGTMSEACQYSLCVGKDRFEARRQVLADLQAAGLLAGEAEFLTRIGRSERTQSVVEPKLSLQWFVRMESISERAKNAVEQDEVRLHPSKFKNTYRHWMENVRDWCISRQLWWGHRIPAYFYGAGENDFVVAETAEEALVLAREASGMPLTMDDLRQDSDVLDTWASSWLWPMAVFNGFDDSCFADGKIQREKNVQLDYFYPTDVLVTAPEILFFWVARMMISSYEYMDEKPFQDVYLTGIVRDKQGRKMSKSLGNSPDPLELIAIYGADAVRTGMLFSSPAGNDLLFGEKLCEQGRNFCNKIWNAFRLLQSWQHQAQDTPSENTVAMAWFADKLSADAALMENHFAKFKIADALLVAYKLVWDDFCARYLEIIKPAHGNPIDEPTYRQTVDFFESLMKLLHPFMPFITEELWHQLRERNQYEALIIQPWVKTASSADSDILSKSEAAFEAVVQIRNVRNQNGISQKDALTLYDLQGAIDPVFFSLIKKLGNLSQIETKAPITQEGIRFIVGVNQFFIPLASERRKQSQEDVEKELIYYKGFLASALNKLNNPKFVNGAPPEVLERERQKKTDAEQKLRILEDILKKG